MSYKGKFLPKNLGKYKGDFNSIRYRSLWERKFMIYCDDNPAIIEWSSEEIIIKYLSPLDHKVHRYFVDFYMKVKTKDGLFKEYLIEVKPEKQLKEPKKQQRPSRRYLKEFYRWHVNQAKWNAAKAWCTKNGMEFKVLTEKHIFKKE